MNVDFKTSESSRLYTYFSSVRFPSLGLLETQLSKAVVFKLYFLDAKVIAYQ